MNIKRILWQWAGLFAAVFAVSLAAARFNIDIAGNRGVIVAATCAATMLYLLWRARLQALPKDPDERLRVMEQRYAAGKYRRDPLRLNALSMLYYKKQNAQRALALTREAIGIIAGQRWLRLPGGGLRLAEVSRYNEAVYLGELERYDEAEQALDTLDEARCQKNPTLLYNMHAIRAQIALSRGNAAAAREHVRLARRPVATLPHNTPENRANIEGHLLLLEARCAQLEHDATAAMATLDELFAAGVTWPPTLEKAAELKDTLGQGKTAGAREA